MRRSTRSGLLLGAAVGIAGLATGVAVGLSGGTPAHGTPAACRTYVARQWSLAHVSGYVVPQDSAVPPACQGLSQDQLRSIVASVVESPKA